MPQRGTQLEPRLVPFWYSLRLRHAFWEYYGTIKEKSRSVCRRGKGLGLTSLTDFKVECSHHTPDPHTSIFICTTRVCIQPRRAIGWPWVRFKATHFVQAVPTSRVGLQKGPVYARKIFWCVGIQPLWHTAGLRSDVDLIVGKHGKAIPVGPSGADANKTCCSKKSRTFSFSNLETLP